MTDTDTRTINHGSLSQLDFLERCVTDVTRWNVDLIDDDLDGLALRWLRLRTLRDQLAVLVTDFEHNVGAKLSDMPYEPTDGYRLPNGQLVHHNYSSTDRWQGRQLLHDLGMPAVDPASGEMISAVPVKVLEQIVPGTATDALTSSNWSTRGLQNLGIDPEDYRTREWKPAKARTGVRR